MYEENCRLDGSAIIISEQSEDTRLNSSKTKNKINNNNRRRKNKKNNEHKELSINSKKNKDNRPKTAFEFCSKQVKLLKNECQKLSESKKAKLYKQLVPLLKRLNADAVIPPHGYASGYPPPQPGYRPPPQQNYNHYPPPPPANPYPPAYSAPPPYQHSYPYPYAPPPPPAYDYHHSRRDRYRTPPHNPRWRGRERSPDYYDDSPYERRHKNYEHHKGPRLAPDNRHRDNPPRRHRKQKPDRGGYPPGDDQSYLGHFTRPPDDDGDDQYDGNYQQSNQRNSSPPPPPNNARYPPPRNNGVNNVVTSDLNNASSAQQTHSYSNNYSKENQNNDKFNHPPSSSQNFNAESSANNTNSQRNSNQFRNNNYTQNNNSNSSDPLNSKKNKNNDGFPQNRRNNQNRMAKNSSSSQQQLQHEQVLSHALPIDESNFQKITNARAELVPYIAVREPKTPTPTGEYVQFIDKPPTPPAEVPFPELTPSNKNDPNSGVLNCELKIRHVLQKLDMSIPAMFKILCGEENTTLSHESLRQYLKANNIDAGEDESEQLIEKYDTNSSDSLFLIEFQRLATAVLGAEYVEKLNTKHLSRIKTANYTNQQVRFMKFLRDRFQQEKLPFSKLWLKLLRHSPNERLDVKSFSAALVKEFDVNVQQRDIIDLCKNFESNFEGLSRASFTKMMSHARALG